MNTPLLLWNGLFLAVTAALLLAPMWPAWQEWRRPKDLASQPLQNSTAPTAAEVPATQRIWVRPGSHFRQLVARQILFGDNTAATPHPVQHHTLPALHVPTHWPHATRWGEQGWRIEGDCQVPAGHRLDGPLVVIGDLWLAHDSLVTGDLKVHGHVRLAPRAVITGALTCPNDIHLGEACAVQGPVLCAGLLRLGDAVRLGSPEHATSVWADHILVEASATAHGSVCASASGQVA